MEKGLVWLVRGLLRGYMVELRGGQDAEWHLGPVKDWCYYASYYTKVFIATVATVCQQYGNHQPTPRVVALVALGRRDGCRFAPAGVRSRRNRKALRRRRIMLPQITDAGAPDLQHTSWWFRTALICLFCASLVLPLLFQRAVLLFTLLFTAGHSSVRCE
jgi:hypothetical protein